MTTRRKFLHGSALGMVAVAAAPVAGMASSTTRSAMLAVRGSDENEALPLQAGATGSLMAGIGRKIITPQLGGLFMGYGSDKGSMAVHDDLTVTALALEDGGNRVVLISATVCLIGNELTAKLRALCGEAAGVSASNVILAATHTHSGPITTDGGDTAYCDGIFIPQCVAAVKEAVDALKPATVGVGKTESLVGINRRQLLANDRVILGQNPWGPYDREMTVVAFKGDDGKTFANIIHCTAHCTASGINTEVTRDWAGVMIDRLEQESGAVTLFFNGLEGDVAPRMANGGSTGDINHAMEVGGVAAIDAVRAYKDIRVYRPEAMTVAKGVVSLPHAPLLPLDEARSELAKLEAGPQARFTGSTINVLKKNIELHEKGETGESFFTYDQTLVRIGSVVFVPVPFEASSELSLRLRTYSKYGHTLGLGCTNGSNSYLPSRDQIPRGGYEVERYLWSGARQLADNADMHLINQNLKLIDNL